MQYNSHKNTFYYRNSSIFMDERVVIEPCLIFEKETGRFIAIGESTCLEEWACLQNFAYINLKQHKLSLLRICKFLNITLERQHDREFFMCLEKFMKANLVREAVIFIVGEEDSLPDLDLGNLLTDMEKSRYKEEYLDKCKKRRGN